MIQPKIYKPADSQYTIYTFKKLDSTNSYIKKHVHKFQDYAIVLADEQTVGRGRYTRMWHSTPCKDLTFSILLPLSSIQTNTWPNITQIAALNLSEMLQDYSIHALIKWPNDILVHSKKICGILCETCNHNSRNYAIIGIGLNVNSCEKDLMRIDQPATSMCIELHRELDRIKILGDFATRFLHSFSLLAHVGFHYFLKNIRKRFFYSHKKIVLSIGDEKISGKILDINGDGTLQFLCEDGEVRNFNSGELPMTYL